MKKSGSAISKEEFAELQDMAANACELLKAMANEWRLMILCQLAEGEKTVSELQALLGLSQSALSQHLAILRHERIVRSRKHAQSVSYSLTGEEAIKVMESLHGVFCEATNCGGKTMEMRIRHLAFSPKTVGKLASRPSAQCGAMRRTPVFDVCAHEHCGGTENV